MQWIPPRVFLACGDGTYGKRLRDSLEIRLGFDVCSDGQDQVNVIRKATAFRPDLVILEMELVSTNAFGVVESIKSVLPKVPLFLVIERPSMRSEREALTRGVDAVFAKEKEEDYASLLRNARAAVNPNCLSRSPEAEH